MVEYYVRMCFFSERQVEMAFLQRCDLSQNGTCFVNVEYDFSVSVLDHLCFMYICATDHE